MNLNVFDTAISQTFTHLKNILSENLGEGARVLMGDNLLKVQFEDDVLYKISKDPANQNIDLQSPQSGNWHFKFEPLKKEWISTQGRKSLFEILAQEFSLLENKKVIISPL